MKPVYFPHTYVPQWAAQILSTCFGHFIVYWPSDTRLPSAMQPWREANVMEVRRPAQIDHRAVKKVVESFRSFAELHQNSAQIKTFASWGQPGSVPFFDETAASRIVWDLKKGTNPETSDKNLDALLCAQVFLHFAQEFDRQNDELKRELGIHAQRSQDLIEKLKGPDEKEEKDLTAIRPAAEDKFQDPAEYMALDRLQAWVQLFMAEPVNSGLFVTSSRSVFNHLVENQGAGAKMIQPVHLPALTPEDAAFVNWRDGFVKRINRLIETGGPEAGSLVADLHLAEGAQGDAALCLYLAEGRSPKDLFASISGTQSGHKSRSRQSAKSKSTLIGFLERRFFDP